MLGERLREAVAKSRLTAEEVANGLGVSKSNLYVLYKKDSFESEYIKRASILLGIPMSYFLDEQQSFSPKSKDGGAFGDAILQEIREEMRMLREQLNVKDQQIAGLQRTVDALVGKSKGVTIPQLSDEEIAFETMFRQYRQLALGNQPYVILPKHQFSAARR